MNVVLVLHADYGPLHRVSVRHAIRMLFREVAVVHEARPDARIVLPRSRGGGDTWENTVAACGRCNNRMRNRTPVEARMSLRRAPIAPTWTTHV